MEYPSLLVLVRHGQTYVNVGRGENDYNPEGDMRLRLTPDHLIELTPEGRQQAFFTGQAIKKRFGTFDYVFHSGYTRTRDTAHLILKAYSEQERRKIKVVEDILIREKERGYTFNMVEAEAVRYFPWLKQYLAVTGRFYSRPPGGESHADLCLRTEFFMKKWAKRLAGKSCLIVSHGHTIRSWRYHLEDLTPERYELLLGPGAVQNCGIFSYRLNEKTGHMEPELVNEIFWQTRVA